MYVYYLCARASSKLVSVKFSIGTLTFDKDSTYQHNNSNFSVTLQYRSENNDEWIMGWNATNILTSHSELLFLKYFNIATY